MFGQPPEFGRCTKVEAEKEVRAKRYRGWFSAPTCLTEDSSESGHYEWQPELVKGGFSMVGTSGLRLEYPGGRATLTCSGVSGNGAITGAKAVADVLLSLTGCTAEGHPCQTPPASSLVQTNPLAGEIAWQDKAEKKVALVLRAETTPEALYYYCPALALEVLVEGSVAVTLTSDKSTAAATLKFIAKKGRQEPETLEGGESHVLKARFYQNYSDEFSESQLVLNTKLSATGEERARSAPCIKRGDDRQPPGLLAADRSHNRVGAVDPVPHYERPSATLRGLPRPLHSPRCSTWTPTWTDRPERAPEHDGAAQGAPDLDPLREPRPHQGLPVSLEVEDLERKLVTERRGGLAGSATGPGHKRRSLVSSRQGPRRILPAGTPWPKGLSR